MTKRFKIVAKYPAENTKTFWASTWEAAYDVEQCEYDCGAYAVTITDTE